MNEERTESAIRRDRFSGGPARSFLSSMDNDQRIFNADLAVDRAHVVMLAEQDIIEDETAGAILEALVDIEAAGFDSLPEAEDVHEAIETAVIELIGPEGGRMHTARSRNDEVATCIRYRLRDDLLDAARATVELREALIGVARKNTEAVMPGMTHLQSAQPTTVGHWALSYVGPLGRDTDRLLDAYRRVNRSPLGGAAFAGTPFPIDRERTASLLGFDGLVENAMDASASRDVAIEATSTLSTLGTTLSGLAADIVLFSHRGWVELDDDYASTSSIMPQKKNPDTMEMVRAAAGDAAAGLVGLTTTIKGLPRAYNRDLQAATPHIWRTADAVTEATEVATGAIDSATWNTGKLADIAGTGFSTATGLADALTMAGLPFRQAHELVARVAEAVGSNPEPTAVEASLRKAAADLDIEGVDDLVTSADLDGILDPAGSVASRNSRGGPAPGAVAEQCSMAIAAVEEDRVQIADSNAALAEAATARAQEVAWYA